MNEAELSALRLAHAKEIADVELRRAQDVNRWAERVVEREKEVEGLQAQLAARPLNRDLESLEHVTDLYGRSLGEWRELSAWIESRVAPLPGERLTLVEMVKHAAMVYAAPQELVYAAPLSPSAPAHDAYTKAAVEYAEACVRAYCGPTFNRVAESGTNYAAFKALYDARKRGEPVSRLTPREQAAVEFAERSAAYHKDGDREGMTTPLRDAYEDAEARYLALRDGVDHLRDATEKVAAPHVIDYSKPASFPLSIEIHGIDQHGKPVDMSDYTATASVRDGKSGLVDIEFSPAKPETVDVWLAMDHRRMIAWCSDLNEAKQWTSATRFVRVRLPVVEVVENEKGGES